MHPPYRFADEATLCGVRSHLLTQIHALIDLPMIILAFAWLGLLLYDLAFHLNPAIRILTYIISHPAGDCATADALADAKRKKPHWLGGPVGLIQRRKVLLSIMTDDHCVIFTDFGVICWNWNYSPLHVDQHDQGDQVDEVTAARDHQGAPTEPPAQAHRIDDV